jgi:hypothetical protein
MAKLGEAPGAAAKALAFAVLTAARSGEVLGAIWDRRRTGDGRRPHPVGHTAG